MEVPWLEKYRPKKLEDIVGNHEILVRLKVIAQSGNMPNVILSGPPGIGKTSSINCLAHELLGEHYNDAVLELNASDERGIDVVRNKIKMFAMKKVSLPTNRHKIIILDEADSMTAGAQQALRRIIEIYSATTRFALACNISSSIIEPIQSRCAIIRFSRLPEASITSRLQHICMAEGVPFTRATLEALTFTADGDMRQAINNLQSVVHGSGDATVPDAVWRICDQPTPHLLEALLKNCADCAAEAALTKLYGIWTQGYSALDIISTLFRVVKGSTTFTEAVQLEFIREIGMVHMRVLEGSNSFLQLSALVSNLCKINLDLNEHFSVSL